MLIGAAHVERSVRTDGHGVDHAEVSRAADLFEQIVHLLVTGDARSTHRDAHEVVGPGRDIVKRPGEPCQSLRHRRGTIGLGAGRQAAHDSHLARGHVDRSQLEVRGIGGVGPDGIEDAALIVGRDGGRGHAEAGMEDILATGVQIEAEDVRGSRTDGIVAGRHLEGHVGQRTAEVLEIPCRRELARAGSGPIALVHGIELAGLRVPHPVERAAGADDESRPDPRGIGHRDAVAGKRAQIEGSPRIGCRNEERARRIGRHVADAAEDHGVARDVGELVLRRDGAVARKIDAHEVVGVLLDVIKAAVVSDEVVRLALRRVVESSAGEAPGQRMPRRVEVITTDPPAAACPLHVVGAQIAGKERDRRRGEETARGADDVPAIAGIELIELAIVAADRKVITGRRRPHAEEAGLAGREPVAESGRRIGACGIHHHAHIRRHRAGIELGAAGRRLAGTVVAGVFTGASEIDLRPGRKRLRTG